MTEPVVLVIGNKNYSSWSLRPWLLLREMSVPFAEQRLLLDTPQFASDIAHWSPSRRVPALRHGELTIWDSLAICEYINETFLEHAGWPSDAAARAIARAVSAEMHSGLPGLAQPLADELPASFERLRRASGCAARHRARRRDLARLPRAFR